MAMKKTAKTKTSSPKTTKESPAKKTAAKKCSAAASASVGRVLKAMKQSTLKSSSGQKVTNPKQAIAIGLSEARRAGAKVPAPPSEEAEIKRLN